jgi:SAM-dependent methyltransferase
MGVMDRCGSVLAPADDLSAIKDDSVDVVVTTRSVPIYVANRRGAFREFHRALVPKGRASVFEPINRFRQPQPPHLLLGYGVTPVRDLAAKVMGVFGRIQPPETDPMLDFDERDPLDLAEEAGFAESYLAYEPEISTVATRHGVTDWETFVRSAGNPKKPAERAPPPSRFSGPSKGNPREPGTPHRRRHRCRPRHR